MNKLIKLSALLLAFTITACSSTKSVDVASDPASVGSVTIEQTQVMLLIGGSSGEGTLTLNGKEYPFEIGGIKLGGIGIHKLDLTGDVYNLENPEDFQGTYFSAEAALTVVKGVGGFWMKNGNGVKIKLNAEGNGLALGLGLEGAKITFK